MPFIKNRRYGNVAWRANATRFIQSRLGNRNRYTSLYKNFKHNNLMRMQRYKVGWSAPLATGKALRAQYKWRRKFYKAHGRVI